MYKTIEQLLEIPDSIELSDGWYKIQDKKSFEALSHMRNTQEAMNIAKSFNTIVKS